MKNVCSFDSGWQLQDARPITSRDIMSIRCISRSGTNQSARPQIHGRFSFGSAYNLFQQPSNAYFSPRWQSESLGGNGTLHDWKQQRNCLSRLCASSKVKPCAASLLRFGHWDEKFNRSRSNVAGLRRNIDDLHLWQRSIASPYCTATSPTVLPLGLWVRSAAHLGQDRKTETSNSKPCIWVCDRNLPPA